MILEEPVVVAIMRLPLALPVFAEFLRHLGDAGVYTIAETGDGVYEIIRQAGPVDMLDDD